MGWKFNPFTGQLDQTGSGGGSAQYIDGEVQYYADLSLDAGVAALNSAWLVREASGAWPLTSRKPAGIYVRTATGGTDRDADYTYAGVFPDVFSDSNFTVYNEADATKNVKLDASAISTGTRTLTVPDASGTLMLVGDAPTAHTHTTDQVTDITSYGSVLVGQDTAAETRDYLGLGNSAVLDTGTGAGTVATGDHTHATAVADPAGSAGFLSSADKQKLDGLGTAATSAATDFVAEATATTKGDILARSASAIIRLGVGADGTVLTADSAEATGVKWAEASGGGGEVRSDFVSPYTYIGLANAGTSESTAAWLIRRSEFDAGGTYVSTTTANNVEWDDRLTASYT